MYESVLKSVRGRSVTCLLLVVFRFRGDEVHGPPALFSARLRDVVLQHGVPVPEGAAQVGELVARVIRLRQLLLVESNRRDGHGSAPCEPVSHARKEHVDHVLLRKRLEHAADDDDVERLRSSELRAHPGGHTGLDPLDAAFFLRALRNERGHATAELVEFQGEVPRTVPEMQNARLQVPPLLGHVSGLALHDGIEMCGHSPLPERSNIANFWRFVNDV